MVAPNVRAGAGSRQREPEKEVDLNHSFSSSVPLNTYLRNPSRLCTWNMEQPPASLRPPATADAAVKTYRRAVTTQVSYRAGLV